ncbi:MAG: redoxin family protein [Pseudomonadota bacterium]
MKLLHFTYAMAAAILMFAAIPAKAAVEIGKPAPEIEATDTNGNAFKLSDHKGKVVVLEWTNHQCPFVVKHYESGNMQATQKASKEHGVEWVSIVSSAPGKQGHVSAQEANAIVTEAGATVTAKILDESGAIGKAYDARTTPHIFIINEEGNVAYAGAIDSNSSPNPKTIEGATNYVLAALEDIKAGIPVQTAQTQPYGCSVKY